MDDDSLKLGVLPDDREQVIDLKGLGEETGGGDLRDSIGGILAGGESDDRRVGRRHRVVLPSELPTIHVRHAHIQNDDVWLELLQDRQGDATVLGRLDVVTFKLESGLNKSANAFVILNDEHSLAVLHYFLTSSIE